MATFKVGQRVRIVGDSQHFGMEGVVMGTQTFEETYCVSTGQRFKPDWCYPVAIPGSRSPRADGLWWKAAHEMRPLTDPYASSFIERVKTWGPLHEEPKVVAGKDLE